MSVAIFILNIFAVKAGGDLGIAIFTSSWRIINFVTITLSGNHRNRCSIWTKKW
ncbi:hypothetical protein [Thermosipho melanesiensis]|uniref:hypothetical protein n=1 Tax=Thermosipho melanesiensis TaxID=46541 RepID=UPI00214B9063|nr:hypothetical protein [Thermosipho melanesiensis]